MAQFGTLDKIQLPNKCQCVFYIGNLTEALQITNEMIEKDPTSALALDNKEAIESKMDDEGENEEEDTHETVLIDKN